MLGQFVIWALILASHIRLLGAAKGEMENLCWSVDS